MCHLICLSLSLSLDPVSDWFNVVFKCHLLAFIILCFFRVIILWLSQWKLSVFFVKQLSTTTWTLGVPSADCLAGELISWTSVLLTGCRSVVASVELLKS